MPEAAVRIELNKLIFHLLRLRVVLTKMRPAACAGLFCAGFAQGSARPAGARKPDATTRQAFRILSLF
jgi:hypothetical protein